MSKQIIRIIKSTNARVSNKCPSKPEGNFSRRPPHKPPKGNNSNTRNRKIR